MVGLAGNGMIDIVKLLESQANSRFDIISITDTVPGSGSKLSSVQVGNSGSFLCTHITGRFTTKSGAAVDSGLCYLRGQLKDGANVPLMDSFIPFDLWMTPGRVKSLAASGDASQPMYAPFKLPKPYLFETGHTVFLDTRNDSAEANSFTVAFIGLRVFSKVR